MISIALAIYLNLYQFCHWSVINHDWCCVSRLTEHAEFFKIQLNGRPESAHASMHTVHDVECNEPHELLAGQFPFNRPYLKLT